MKQNMMACWGEHIASQHAIDNTSSAQGWGLTRRKPESFLMSVNVFSEVVRPSSDGVVNGDDAQRIGQADVGMESALESTGQPVQENHACGVDAAQAADNVQQQAMAQESDSPSSDKESGEPPARESPVTTPPVAGFSIRHEGRKLTPHSGLVAIREQAGEIVPAKKLTEKDAQGYSIQIDRFADELRAEWTLHQETDFTAADIKKWATGFIKAIKKLVTNSPTAEHRKVLEKELLNAARIWGFYGSQD